MVIEAELRRLQGRMGDLHQIAQSLNQYQKAHFQLIKHLVRRVAALEGGPSKTE